MQLTPQQSAELILKIDQDLLTLGMALVPAFSDQLWKVDGTAVRLAYNQLAADVRALQMDVYLQIKRGVIT